MIDSATFFKRKHWTLLAATVLAGCSTTAPRTGSEAPTPVTPPAATYAKAAWSALPPVSDTDLQAGFIAWRSSCPRLKNDAVWAKPCATAAAVSDKDPAAIRQPTG
ncbi:hypothetical protein G6F40_016854 [Rhizopus arrhizus]|nr:hypothetical protein G6F40_016854 [Rhizopus arrhizus]